MVIVQWSVGYLFSSVGSSGQYLDLCFWFCAGGYIYLSVCAGAFLCGDSSQYLLFHHDDLRSICLEEAFDQGEFSANPYAQIILQVGTGISDLGCSVVACSWLVITMLY